MTQHQKILNLLADGDWICSSKFYAEYIADPRTRICELKKKGYQLESRKCQQHDYHNGGSKEWRLVGRLDGDLTKYLSEPENIAPLPSTIVFISQFGEKEKQGTLWKN